MNLFLSTIQVVWGTFSSVFLTGNAPTFVGRNLHLLWKDRIESKSFYIKRMAYNLQLHELINLLLRQATLHEEFPKVSLLLQFEAHPCWISTFALHFPSFLPGSLKVDDPSLILFLIPRLYQGHQLLPLAALYLVKWDSLATLLFFPFFSIPRASYWGYYPICAKLILDALGQTISQTCLPLHTMVLIAIEPSPPSVSAFSPLLHPHSLTTQTTTPWT